jgi:hypothetical protein
METLREISMSLSPAEILKTFGWAGYEDDWGLVLSMIRSIEETRSLAS